MDNIKYTNLKKYIQKEQYICDDYKILQSNSCVNYIKKKKKDTIKEPFIVLKADNFTKYTERQFTYNNNNRNINISSNRNININNRGISNSNCNNSNSNNSNSNNSNSNNSNSNNSNSNNSNSNIDKTNTTTTTTATTSTSTTTATTTTTTAATKYGITYKKKNIFAPEINENIKSGNFSFSPSSVEEKNFYCNKFFFKHYNEHTSNVSKNETTVPFKKNHPIHSFSHNRYMVKEWTEYPPKKRNGGETKREKNEKKEKCEQTCGKMNVLRKGENEIKNLKREDELFNDFLNRKNNTLNGIDKTNNTGKEKNISSNNSLKLENDNAIKKRIVPHYTCNSDLLTSMNTTTMSLKKKNDVKLEDIYFDIHMDDYDYDDDDADTLEKEQKKRNCKSLSENTKKEYKENNIQILLDHIKRLEHQNEIFLNNLLNMYYVCMDYMKMQDNKIKEKEQIIENLKKQMKQKNDIINMLQNRNHNSSRSLYYKKNNE